MLVQPLSLNCYRIVTRGCRCTLQRSPIPRQPIVVFLLVSVVAILAIPIRILLLRLLISGEIFWTMPKYHFIWLKRLQEVIMSAAQRRLFIRTAWKHLFCSGVDHSRMPMHIMHKLPLTMPPPLQVVPGSRRSERRPGSLFIIEHGRGGQKQGDLVILYFLCPTTPFPLSRTDLPIRWRKRT